MNLLMRRHMNSFIAISFLKAPWIQAKFSASRFHRSIAYRSARTSHT
jgi:hypothetical protein